MTKAAMWLRTSSGNRPRALRLQRDAIRSYAEKNSLEITAEFALKGVSAYKDVTPIQAQVNRVVDLQPAYGYDTLLVRNVDRFTRFLAPHSETLLKTLEEAGIRLVTTDYGTLSMDNPMQHSLYKLLSYSANCHAWKAEQAAQASLENRREKGLRIGRPRDPFSKRAQRQTARH